MDQRTILEWMWLVEIVVGIILFAFLNWGLKKGLKVSQERTFAKSHFWRERLMHIVYLPLHILLWILAIAYVLDILAHRFSLISIPASFHALRNACIILLFGWTLFRWKKELQKVALFNRTDKKIAIDSSTVHVLGKLASILIFVLTALLILQVLGLNIVPLIAFGGIGAAAIGFAGKDVIANFFGGLMLYIARPFIAGDQILLPEKEIEGTIEEIGWYMTSIRDKEKRPVYLPNSNFSKMVVINSSRMTRRRLEMRIAIRYEDFEKIDAIVQQIKKIIKDHPKMDGNLPCLIHFEGFEDSGLSIYIDSYCYETELEHFYPVREEILSKIYTALLQLQVEIPYTTTEVRLRPSKETF